MERSKIAFVTNFSRTYATTFEFTLGSADNRRSIYNVINNTQIFANFLEMRKFV